MRSCRRDLLFCCRSPAFRRTALNRSWTWSDYWKGASAQGTEGVLHMEVDLAEPDMEAETRSSPILIRTPSGRSPPEGPSGPIWHRTSRRSPGTRRSRAYGGYCGPRRMSSRSQTHSLGTCGVSPSARTRNASTGSTERFPRRATPIVPRCVPGTSCTSGRPRRYVRMIQSFRPGTTGEGARVETSLVEALLTPPFRAGSGSPSAA